MKFNFLNIIIAYILLIIACLFTTTRTGLSSYLKIDLVEAINLHCKLNNEFYCHPYALIEFKHSTETKTSKSIECTKHPKWESSFTFSPELCYDTVYIHLYQYLTPRDKAYLDTAKNEDEDPDKGDYKPGYLGRVELELEKIPLGIVDDWFMIDSPSENLRIEFPSCVHLRIYWTSSKCSKPGHSTEYQINSISNRNIKEKFEPKNYIPMCKKEFALIYKTKFSRIDSEEQIKKKNELDNNINRKDVINQCKMDLNTDYGFLHKYSNLTSIEEALVYKIIKRTTGENINYEEFTSEYNNANSDKKYVKSYKEFFERNCFNKPDMTIERVNNILKNDAESFPKNTTNYYLSPDMDKLDFTEKTNLNQLESVYKDTLNQFYAIEDLKNLKTMDDDSYIETLNKLTKVIKTIHAEKKIDETIYEVRNKVLLTNEGLINPKEEYFFRIYALYKWNGGQYPYDDIKREFMLRRKYFDCYERVDMMPTNMIFQFVEDMCPNNYVCVDPNGIVINSIGRNPNEVFAKEIEETKLKFLERAKYKDKNYVCVNNKIIDSANMKENNNQKNLRFRQNISINSNKNENSNTSNDSKIEDNILNINGNNNNNEIDSNRHSDSDSNSLKIKNEFPQNSGKINFEDLIKMETILPEYETLDEPIKISSFIKSDTSSKPTKITPYISTITYKNKFDKSYELRLIRIKKKKEVIINKVFNHIPLIGEILSIANLGADKFLIHPDLENSNAIEHIDQKFLEREKDLLKKYLLLYDANIPYVEHSAKVLLDLILCNNDKNSIAYVLRELLEGLCYGDDRSIKIFVEIVRTVLIDALVLKPFYHFNDLNAKINLLNTLNKPLCYKAITKIRFLELMLMYDYLKEKITFVIYNNNTNKIIEERINKTEKSVPETLTKNKRSFSSQIGNEHDDASNVNKNYLAEMDRIKSNFEDKKKREKLNEKNSFENEFRFKSVEKSHEEDEDIIKRIKTLRNIIDDDENKKKNLSDDLLIGGYNGLLSNMNNITNHVIKYNNVVSNVESISVAGSSKDDDLMNEFKDFFNDTPKNSNNSTDVVNEDNKSLTYINDMKLSEISTKNKERKKIQNSSNEIYIKGDISNSQHSVSNSDSYHSFKLESSIENSYPKFKSLTTNKQVFSDTEDDSEDSSKQSSNKNYNTNINVNSEDKSHSTDSTNKQLPSEDNLNRIILDSIPKNIIEVKHIPVNNILYPKEIHTIYEVNKKGTKQITINKDNPTKKLIINNLMEEKSFNDLMDQGEKKEDIDDKTGLYNVLKKIQNRKCSIDFLCIEIGAIYGPFDNLKPQNVTVSTKQKENVHVIIKPIILVKNNKIPAIEEKPVIPAAPLSVDDDDCDILKTSTEKDTNINNSNMRFKQLVDKDAKKANLKRKFYRKVEMGNEILASDIFKEGLNLIILKREKGYPKIFERTYATNSDPIQSDAMACVLRDAGYDKILVITGIGKWMGSITPRLIKEIKQIGGPNLSYLVTSDGDDNSKADRSFILIGRRGLCRYNGVFRLKNYDITSDMKKYFPDLSSDPNDCYFDDMKNENKNKENQFSHKVQLRLTLNLCNDNRFSTKAAVVTNVFPNSGPLNGGQPVKIRGLNFGDNTLGIKEVLIRGVICKNVVLETPFLISCISGSSTIMGPGFGNVQVKLLCGLSSPENSCNLYQYTTEVLQIEEPTVIKHDIIVTHSFESPVNNNNDGLHLLAYPLPRPEPVMTFLPQPIPAPIMHVAHSLPPVTGVHHIKAGPNSIFAHPPPLFSFKQKQNNQVIAIKDNNTRIMLDRLNNKEYFYDQKKEDNVDIIDNLVTDNYKNILSRINSNSFITPKDGFRKRRFKNIFAKLK